MKDDIIYKDKWRIYINVSTPLTAAAWVFSHDDYDGAEDAHDYRCGYGSTIQNCKDQIDNLIEEEEEEEKEKGVAT